MKNIHQFKLALYALIRFVYVLIAMGISLFLPAGTISFSGGIHAICILLIPTLILGIVLFFRNPIMLKKRLETKETRKEQKIITAVMTAIIGSGLIVSGIDYRFTLTSIPKFLKFTGVATTIFSYILYGLVFSKNKFLHKTICVENKQYVIDDGIYGLIRHPMYLATIMMYFSIAIATDSLLTVLIFLLLLPIVYFRINDEENFLKSALPGYVDYIKKVKYRLVPYIW